MPPGLSLDPRTNPPRRPPFAAARWLVLLAFVCLPACQPESDDHRLHIKYWEKWTGFEGEAMRGIVDDYNASQTRVHVDYSSVSQIDRKLMLATAGGVPPDVAGLWAIQVPVYSENNALTPLDRLAREAGIKREDYIDAVWRLCSHRNKLFALPSACASIALVWNKKMFREAGLDPERPPRSIAELEEFNQKLLRRRPDGSIQSIGHLPNEPGWWAPMWGYWWGGRLWDANSTVNATAPENLAAFHWLASYPERFGARDLVALRDGFGTWASPQSPFMSGRVAMELQGVWIYNYIKNFAPADFEWGVAAFPSADPEKLKDVTIVESDVLVVPAGSRHPREGFEFIRYVNSQGPMEKLALSQRKFPARRKVSDGFYAKHPDPYIHVFADLADSPNARVAPRMTSWTEYNADMNDAISRVWAGNALVDVAFGDVQTRQQTTLDHRRQRWQRNEAKLTAAWAREETR